MQPLLPIKNKAEYQKAVARYEEIRNAPKNSAEHKEKMALVVLVSQYEEQHWTLPALDPAEINQIRKEEFGYSPC
jgi:HTH-type transcriptional regulator/antitoxin HigA